MTFIFLQFGDVNNNIYIYIMHDVLKYSITFMNFLKGQRKNAIFFKAEGGIFRRRERGGLGSGTGNVGAWR